MVEHIMQCLCFADLHCHNYAQHSRTLPNGLNSRFVDCLKIIQQARELVQERSIPLVVFAGDLYESRTLLPVEVLSETYRAMRDLIKMTKVVILLGNHDMWSRVGDVYAIESYRDICELADTPRTLQIDKYKISFVPYRADAQQFDSEVEALPESDALFLHQTFTQAVAGPSDHKIKTKLTLSRFPKDRFRHIISGDIHKRQFHAKWNFHYVGSPLQLNLGERGEEKCFSIIDFATGFVESVLTVAPKFHLLEAGDDDPAKLEFSSIAPTDFIHLRYMPKWVDSAMRLKRDFQNLTPEMVSPHVERIKETRKEVSLGDRGLVEEYVRREIAAGRADKEEFDTLVDIGMQELLEAQQ